MRRRGAAGGLSVHAIAGSSVVLLGMNVAQRQVGGLLGFAIERTDHLEGERYWLPNFLLFEVNDKGSRSDHSSLRNPFQEFLWGDYTAKPEHTYTYRVVAMYGRAGALEHGPEARVRITTASERSPLGAVYFNRGLSVAQRYVERFGDRPPNRVPYGEAYKWLSRGLEEGLLAFIGRADSPSWGLRAALYEFSYAPVLDAFRIAADSGADVRIVYDNSRESPGERNVAAIDAAGIPDLTIPRTNTSRIPHNKFIVLLRNRVPIAVWTGSTNITEGGIFGHSNVGHVVRDARVAKSFYDYWRQLSLDPPVAQLRTWVDRNTPTPVRRPYPNSVRALFSPRSDIAMLDWYARMMDGAKDSVFLTAAFGVNEVLREVFEKDVSYLRYLLLERDDETIETINRDPDNRVVAGGYVGQRDGWHQWLSESPTGLNEHVKFIHTKYMLVDPLGNDPIVITGSANFSNASVRDNDENMLVFRGNTHLADLYLGEFMRLFTHFRFRGKTKTPPREPAPSPAVRGGPKHTRLYLRDSDEWARRFFVPGSPELKERRLFACR